MDNERKKSGLSTASMVLGIVALCTCFIPIINNLSFIMGVLAIIFGIIGICKKSLNRGMAIAGLVLGILSCIGTLNAQKSLSESIDKAFEGVTRDYNGVVVDNKESKTDNTNEKDENNDKTTSSNKEIDKVALGQSYVSKTEKITFTNYDDDFKGYSKYASIKSGYKVVKADFEFENLGKSEFYVSSYDFDCYADGYDCDSFYSFEDSSFSASLSTGKKTKGSVCFQVPIDAKEIEMEYELNMFMDSKVIFKCK